MAGGRRLRHHRRDRPPRRFGGGRRSECRRTDPCDACADRAVGDRGRARLALDARGATLAVARPVPAAVRASGVGACRGRRAGDRPLRRAAATARASSCALGAPARTGRPGGDRRGPRLSDEFWAPLVEDWFATAPTDRSANGGGGSPPRQAARWLTSSQISRPGTGAPGHSSRVVERRRPTSTASALGFAAKHLDTDVLRSGPWMH